MSLTFVGLATGIVAWLLKTADIPIANGVVENFVQVTLAIVAAVMVYWGRFRKGDLTVFGTRK